MRHTAIDVSPVSAPLPIKAGHHGHGGIAASDDRAFERSFAALNMAGVVADADLLSSDKTLVEPTTVLAAARPTRETLMTDRPSMSLGVDAYAAHLTRAGLRLDDCRSDEGENNYYEAVKPI